MNGPIGKQMVDTLVESSANFEMILKFFDIFLKMKDMTTSEAFLVIVVILYSMSTNLKLFPLSVIGTLFIVKMYFWFCNDIKWNACLFSIENRPLLFTVFQEYDLNKDGYISPKEFRIAMYHQKLYARFVQSK